MWVLAEKYSQKTPRRFSYDSFGIVVCALCSHQWRDAQRRGLYFWPIPYSTPPIPFYFNIACLVLLPMIVLIVHSVSSLFPPFSAASITKKDLHSIPQAWEYISLPTVFTNRENQGSRNRLAGSMTVWHFLLMEAEYYICYYFLWCRGSDLWCGRPW